LEYWINEAQKKLVYDKIKAAFAARMGAVTGEGFNAVIQSYQDQLAEIEGKHPDEERVADAWTMLKARGKG
jgi:hypothetical protein